jgi:hypothetical protein
MRTAKDLHLGLAFRAIGAHCAPHVPFPVLDYSEFLMRMKSVVERHGNLGTGERVLFGAWKSRPRTTRIAQPQARVAVCFRPVLQAAA